MSRENKENQSLFDKELQDAIDGKLPKSHIFTLGVPCEILQRCGFPKGQRIEMSLSRLKFKSTLTRHPFELSDIFGLEKALQSPVAVFEYGDKTKAQNVIVNIEKDGKNFLAGIHFNQDSRGYEVSDLRTLYPKDNIEWLNWISQGKMIYGNKKELQALTAQQRMNFAEVSGQVVQSPLHERCLKSIENILSKFRDVNDIFTDDYPFYKDVKLHGEIENKFFTYYTSKGNLDARALSENETEEFYAALKNNDTEKINEYKDERMHEISEIASEIEKEYSNKKEQIMDKSNNYYQVNEKFAIEFIKADKPLASNKRGDDWLVRFYDTEQKNFNDFGRNAQFVSSYYASTLLYEYKKGTGLALQGGVPAWSVDEKTMDYVKELTDKWIENHKEKNMENTKKEITAKELQSYIENLKIKHPSKWTEAVKDDAADLVGNYIEWNGEDAPFKAENVKDLLNGAQDWKQYSEGGLGLIYDTDIAMHYSTPAELKKLGFKEGNGIIKNPNAKETWLDVQARALFQASELIKKSVHDIEMKREKGVEQKSPEKTKAKSKEDDFGIGR